MRIKKNPHEQADIGGLARWLCFFSPLSPSLGYIFSRSAGKTVFLKQVFCDNCSVHNFTAVDKSRQLHLISLELQYCM